MASNNIPIESICRQSSVIKITMFFLLCLTLAISGTQAESLFPSDNEFNFEQPDRLMIQVAKNPPIQFKVTKYFPIVLAIVLIPLFFIPVGALIFWILSTPVI